MKPSICIFLFLALIPTAFSQAQIIDTVYSSQIKTIIISHNNTTPYTPILSLHNDDHLSISFDELAEQPNNYYYKIIHCNKSWQPDSLQDYEYINGNSQAPISHHDFSFTTYQPYIHYHQTFPEPYTTFEVSGNYALLIYLQTDQEDSLVITRRFYVTEQALQPTLQITKSTIQPQANQEVTISLAAPNPTNAHLLNPNYLHVMLQQNHRPDLLRTLPFSGYSAGELTYRFQPQNTFPGGNCFRFFDLSNLRTPMYNIQKVETFGGETFAIIRPQESRANKNFSLEQTLNGGFKINIWDRRNPTLEADYVWVNLSLPMDIPYLDGSVHIVGDLTQWTLGEASRMEWNPKYHAYILRLYLKQGYYAYQILFQPTDHTQPAQTDRIEGDHYETPNTYTTFIYSRQPGERYDRLLSIQSNQQ